MKALSVPHSAQAEPVADLHAIILSPCDDALKASPTLASKVSRMFHGAERCPPQWAERSCMIKTLNVQY
ncbi:hypothetical protein DSL92_02960 [Billgrantia gudaonensis]|uniref:Uncharacterized protein n=1 Tax=Billgrantia gudaonensis TaxID=376427 RepID=A0A3S0QG93_9GAMM|nr:hypothetical protein DSL92_02960 [Halomonas gudaonensis]